MQREFIEEMEPFSKLGCEYLFLGGYDFRFCPASCYQHKVSILMVERSLQKCIQYTLAIPSRKESSNINYDRNPKRQPH